MSLLGKNNAGGKNYIKPQLRLGNYDPTSVKQSYNSSNNNSQFLFSRVMDVITSTDHPLYDSLGLKALGAAILKNISQEINTIDKDVINYDNPNLFIAYPLFPHIKDYPLKNEIVITLIAPNFNTQSSPKNISAYYICSTNIWNNSHHNALPDTRINNSQSNLTDSKTYFNSIPTNSGVGEESEDIELGNFFKENEYIKNLLSYEGDVIYEGRFGNSIRFGSTNKNTPTINNWSDSGENGDPLTIIRVKKFTSQDISISKELTTLEDINKDDSSIWLTSTQQIPIDINFL